MQTLIVQVTTDFVGDASALVNGFGRIVTHMVMAPIERIANACDVAGILPGRRAGKVRANAGVVMRNSIHGAGQGRGRRSQRRRGGLGCLRFLGQLT
jgi:hypothetical protein